MGFARDLVGNYIGLANTMFLKDYYSTPIISCTDLQP